MEEHSVTLLSDHNLEAAKGLQCLLSLC